MLSNAMLHTPNKPTLSLYTTKKQQDPQDELAPNNGKDTVAQLQSQLNTMQKLYDELMLKYTVLERKLSHTDTEKIEYWTDEEELSKETEWIRVRNAKKRKASSSPKEPVQSSSIKNTRQQQQNHTERKPPPVIISKINNYNALTEDLVKNQIKFQTSMLAGGRIKINVNDESDYRNLTTAVKNMNLEWHSFQDKQTRPIKVVVRNLHHTCKIEDITADLKDKKLNILDVCQLLRSKDKTPLPLFVLTFSREEDIKKIYEIGDILHMKVKIEAFKKPKLIPQCKNCQDYGHTQKYCGKEPRCVKCAGKHHTIDCKKPSNTPAKCVHCGEAHPANYRGCTTAITLQELRNKANNKKLPDRQHSEASNNRTNGQRLVDDHITYSQITSGLEQAQGTSSADSTTVMLQKIMKQIQQQEKRQEEFKKSILDRLAQLENLQSRRLNRDGK